MTLISIDSIQYKRRLVRALNMESVNGFYVNIGDGTWTERCNRARLVDGRIQVKSLWQGWVNANEESFCDAYGQEIHASIVA